MQLHDDLHTRHYLHLMNQVELGHGLTAQNITSPDQLKTLEGFRRNISQFSAHKQYTARTHLERLRGLPLADFLKEGEKYMATSNSHWLESETQTARSAATSADQWQDYQDRKYLYPNIEYSTVGDQLVREAHAVLDGAVYPVDHVFWDTYFPPNGYRCRCITLQTDDKPNMVQVEWLPDKGMRHNPGRSSVAFDDSHPYFDVDPLRRQSLDRNAEKLRADREWESTKKMAIERFEGSTWSLPGKSQAVKIEPRGLDQVRSILQADNFRDPAIASDLLTLLHVVMPMLQPVNSQQYFLELLGTTYTFSFTEQVLTSITTQ